MTTSGVTALTITRDEIIITAMEEIGAIAAGELPTPEEVISANRRLNVMIKSMQAAGVGLWLNKLVTLPLQYARQSYLLGPTGDPCSTSMGETTLASAGAAGDASITVDSASGITAGMNIGIVLDGGSIQWTTVSGAPVGSVVPLTAVLTGDAADGSVIFYYSTLISRPLRDVEFRIKDVYGNETALTPMSRDEYMTLPLKSSTGKTTQYYYDPQTDNAVLYVWPVNLVMSDRIVGTVRFPVQVFVNLDDEPDFPVEWFQVLYLGLALRLCPSFTVPPARYAEIKELYAIALADANDFDREQNVSMQFAVSTR